MAPRAYAKKFRGAETIDTQIGDDLTNEDLVDIEVNVLMSKTAIEPERETPASDIR